MQGHCDTIAADGKHLDAYSSQSNKPRRNPKSSPRGSQGWVVWDPSLSLAEENQTCSHGAPPAMAIPRQGEVQEAGRNRAQRPGENKRLGASKTPKTKHLWGQASSRHFQCPAPSLKTTSFLPISSSAWGREGSCGGRYGGEGVRG